MIDSSETDFKPSLTSNRHHVHAPKDAPHPADDDEEGDKLQECRQQVEKEGRHALVEYRCGPAQHREGGDKRSCNDVVSHGLIKLKQTLSWESD